MWYDHRLTVKCSGDLERNLQGLVRDNCFPFCPGHTYRTETMIHSIIHTLHCLHHSEQQSCHSDIEISPCSPHHTCHDGWLLAMTW